MTGAVPPNTAGLVILPWTAHVGDPGGAMKKLWPKQAKALVEGFVLGNYGGGSGGAPIIGHADPEPPEPEEPEPEEPEEPEEEP